MGIKVYNLAAFERAPDLVVFDLDNTLYDYAPAHEAALTAAARKAQALFGADETSFLSAYAAARDDVHKRLRYTAASHSRLLYFTNLAERLAIGAQPAIALDLEQTYWMAFLNSVVLLPGAVDLLDDLRIARITMALVTDLTAQIQYRKLVYWDLDRYFATVVTSEEAGAEKPAPAPFLLAQSRLPSPATTVWAIGNSVEKDLVGAREVLGAITLLRTPTLSTAPTTGVDLAFDDFHALRKLLGKLTERTN